MTFDEKWLEPGATVPVTMDSVHGMMNEIRRLRSAASEDLVVLDNSAEAKKADYWADVLVGGWIREQIEEGKKDLNTINYSAVRDGVILGLSHPTPQSGHITCSPEIVHTVVIAASGERTTLDGCNPVVVEGSGPYTVLSSGLSNKGVIDT